MQDCQQVCYVAHVKGGFYISAWWISIYQCINS